jgi:hypothetical protein
MSAVRVANCVRVPVALLMAVMMLAIGGLGMPRALAQDVAPELSREGRLGGTLAEVQEERGPSDWTDVGLVGYNSVVLDGVDTILVVYFDGEETVTKFSLVYLEKPAAFVDSGNIAGVVAEVTPRDGTCEAKPIDTSGLGPEVYICEAASLEGIYSKDQLNGLGVRGADGAYSYSVDPLDDGYFEVIVQFGTDSFEVTPTPAPPAPTPTPSLTDEYPPIADVRELAIGRGFEVGDKLSVSGPVQTIFVDGNFAQMQLAVAAPDGSNQWVVVVYEGDTTGIFEGSYVTAYGVYADTTCFTNALGGEVCQPLIIADELT